MTYNPNIPQPGDFLSDSQSQILNNFSSANASFGINHVNFATATNNGKHKFCELLNQAAVPTPVSNQGVVYTKKDASNRSQLFYSPDSTGDEYQITRVIGASIATFSTNPGWTFLPGGMLMQWGTASSIAGGTATVVFPVAFTATPYSIQATVFQNTANRHSVYIKTMTNTGFVSTNLDGGGSGEINTFTWVAIGK